MAFEHTSHPTHTRISTLPTEIHQSQWEAALDKLHRHIPDPLIRPHWQPTGALEIDAQARTLIGEYLLFSGQYPWPNPTSPAESAIFEAFQHTHLDLYVVEINRPTLILRNLRSHRGYTLHHIEGRTLPAPATILATRHATIGPPNRIFATLPLAFPDSQDIDSPIPALLRAFGASPLAHTWADFMRSHGERLCLEYALEHLRHAARPKTSLSSLTHHFRALHQSFHRLHRALQDTPDRVALEHLLRDGSLAIIEDLLDSPQLILFASPSDRERYFRALPHSNAADPPVPWVRVHLLRPEEVHPVEWEFALRAGLSPDLEDLIRVQARNAHGLFIDPTIPDLLRLDKACQEMLPPTSPIATPTLAPFRATV